MQMQMHSQNTQPFPLSTLHTMALNIPVLWSLLSLKLNKQQRLITRVVSRTWSRAL